MAIIRAQVGAALDLDKPDYDAAAQLESIEYAVGGSCRPSATIL